MRDNSDQNNSEMDTFYAVGNINIFVFHGVFLVETLN